MRWAKGAHVATSLGPALSRCKVTWALTVSLSLSALCAWVMPGRKDNTWENVLKHFAQHRSDLSPLSLRRLRSELLE